MDLKGYNIGYCLCGSFCTFAQSVRMIEKLTEMGAEVQPVLSGNAAEMNTRFGKAQDFMEQLKKITKNDIITTIKDAEPIGPNNSFDVLVVSPCTGNTLAKLNAGITDTTVTMAVKAHIRNNKPVVAAIATNDALGVSLKNIGGLMIRKNFYFVPFGQDNPVKKPLSMIADFEKIPETIEKALNGEQIQPVIFSRF